MPTIPLQVFITPFAEKGKVEPAAWSCDAADDALTVANGIWRVANIQFMIKDCSVDKPLDMAKGGRTSDRQILDVLSLRHPGSSVNIFLINRIASLTAGGASYLDSDPVAASFVQMYDQMNTTGRALAHELGHLLSLDHMKVDFQHPERGQRNNLMVEGMITGGDLTTDQINSAKTSKLAKKF